MRDLHREIGRDALGAGARVAPRILPFAPVDRISGVRERCDTIISLWGLIQNGSGVAAQANAQVGSIWQVRRETPRAGCVAAREVVPRPGLEPG